MNGQTAKLLRKIAKTIGRTPKYVKKHYKSMTPEQQVIYRAYMQSMFKNMDLGKEINGSNVPSVPRTDSPTA